jgi:hypothetical protein
MLELLPGFGSELAGGGCSAMLNLDGKGLGCGGL